MRALTVRPGSGSPRVDEVPAREWDSCRNGRSTEHGIVRLDGSRSERRRSSSA